MKYIPYEKMKALREAAKNGDQLAKKILRAQMDGNDFSADLESYFAPKANESEEVEEEVQVTPTEIDVKSDERLEKFLSDNGITKDSPEYDEAVKEFYAEVGGKNPEEEDGFENLIKKLMKEESDAIDSYSKAITKVMNDETIEPTHKRRVIARLEEIRVDEKEHFRELGELLQKENDNLEQNSEL